MNKVVKVVLLALSGALACASLSAQEAQPSEYQVKAAFLFNFAKFVEWPTNTFASDSAPIRIGVLGENPFDGGLEKMVTGKTINGHPVVVCQSANAADLGTCHIVFISRKEKDANRLANDLRVLGKSSVLTVSDVENFTDPACGGIIGFFMEGNKVRFAINVGAARKAGLTINSKLLNLAKKRGDG